MTKLKAKRNAYKHLIEEKLKEIESCKGEPDTCGCSELYSFLEEKLKTLKSTNKDIFEKDDKTNVEEDIFVEEMWVINIEVKIKKLKQKVLSHQNAENTLATFKSKKVIKKVEKCVYDLFKLKLH